MNNEKLKSLINENNFFDELFYIRKYKDVRFSDLLPLDHYIRYGINEHRQPNSSFNINYYKNLQLNEKDNYNLIKKIILQNKKEKNLLNDDYQLVKKSEYFNSKYYLMNNADVKGAGVDPIIHFLEHGYKEKRNPSKLFDIDYYISKYPDIKLDKINPLLHYLKFGYKENRETFEFKNNNLFYFDIDKMFNNEIQLSSFDLKKPIDIVIPVYNGFEYLEPLFNSIIDNTSLKYRLLICDDKSSDERVLPFLNLFVRNNKNIEIKLLINEKNLGFIKTVNKLSKYTENHFVLLNTDTEVPKNWIQRLMYPIFYMENIASTTPFTNAGTICSFPNYLEDNKILQNMSVNDIDKYFSYVNFHYNYIEIPTGVGFCMGVNKNLVDRIGMFDEIFGKGYGEENDWCQRAIKEGYKNIHVPNLFVYHKHGGSFPSEEKKRLIETNLKTLNEKHNNFDKEVQKTIKENSLELLRNILYFKISSEKKYTKLIFDHDLGGGANHYIDDIIEKKIKEDEIIFQIKYDFKKLKKYKISFLSKEKIFEFEVKGLFNLENILKNFTFKEIFINSLVSFPNMEDVIILIKKLKNKNNKLIIPIHDFFPLCPSYTLLNYKSIYCNIPSNYSECNMCLKSHYGEFSQFENEDNIENWRKNWNELFKITDEILCFSNSSKNIFLKAYPNYTKEIVVIPHNIQGRYNKIFNPDDNFEKNIIGILGGINEAKGANIVKNLVKKIELEGLNAKIILIGEISIPIEPSDYFYCTGRYKHDDLPTIVKEQKITQFLIPSIWPETFSYTTDEIMQLGYPLTVFNLGAPAERVKNYVLGKVIEIDEINKLFE